MINHQRLLLLFLSSLLFSALFAQIPHNWHHCSVSPGARTVLVERYYALEQDGHIIAGNRYPANADIYGLSQDYQINFAADGLVRNIRHYYAGERTDNLTNYTHNTENQLTQTTLITPRRKYKKHIYTHFGDHKVLDKILGKPGFLHPKGSFQLGNTHFGLAHITLNADGLPTEILRKQPNGGNVYRLTNTYGYNGQLLKSVYTRDLENSITHKRAYTHTKTYTYRYTRNSRGDWTQAIIRLDDKPLMIVKRTISYQPIAPRPLSKQPIDINTNILVNYLLAAVNDPAACANIQNTMHKLHQSYLKNLATLQQGSAKFKDGTPYKDLMALDARRQRYLRVYEALASQCTGKDIQPIQRQDYDDIVRHDLRWAGWTTRTLSSSTKAIKRLELKRNKMKMVIAINTLPAGEGHARDITYHAYYSGDKQTCTLPGGTCRILYHN